jgi:hypothetical protein
MDELKEQIQKTRIELTMENRLDGWSIEWHKKKLAELLEKQELEQSKNNQNDNENQKHH